MKRHAGKQTDPFNATDPVMPWDGEPEYVPISAHTGDTCEGEHATGSWDNVRSADDAERSKPSREQKSNAASRTGKSAASPAARESKSSRAKDATSSRGTSPRNPFRNDADEHSELSDLKRQLGAALSSGTSHRSARHSTRSTTSRKGSSANLGLIFLLIVGFTLVSTLFTCGKAFITSTQTQAGELVTGIFTSKEGPASKGGGLSYEDYIVVTSELEQQQTERIKNAVSLIRGDNDALVAQAAKTLDSSFFDNYGLTLTDAGVDTKALASWALDSFSADFDSLTAGAYSTDDSDEHFTGYAGLSATAPSIQSMLWDLGSYIEYDLLGMERIGDYAFTSQSKALVQAKLEELKEHYRESELYLSFDYEGALEPDTLTPIATPTELEQDTILEQIFAL